MGKRRNIHNGGQQLPLGIVVPHSDWVAPTELPDLTRFDAVAIDTETNDEGLAAGLAPSWHTGAGYICGVSAAWKGGGIYVPVNHPDTPGCFSEERVGNWLGHLFRSDTLVVMQEATYDLGWVGTKFGLSPPKRIADTIAASVIVDENLPSYHLDDLCKWRGIPGKDERLLNEAAATYGIHPKKEIYKLPARFVASYAIQDGAGTLGVWEQTLPIMQKEKTFAAFQVEMDLLPLTIEMRRTGIRVNERTVHETKARLKAQAERMLDELANRLELSRNRVGIDEIRKSGIVADWHDRYKISYPSTPTGLPSFKKEWMQNHEHWLPRLVTRIDQMFDMTDKFIDKFILKFLHNGRIHPNINQYRSTDEDGDTSGTRSHRFSYSKPALQEAPARDEDMCVAFRGCFEPEPGEIWGSHDFSQQEFKWMVHYAYRCGLPKADIARQRYIDDPETDFHRLVASLTGLARGDAKNTNFAKAYGAGIKKFALMSNMPVEKAAGVMGQYDTEMPFILGLNKVCMAHAQRGYIIMHDGARSHFNLFEPKWVPIDVKKAAYKDPHWSSQMAPCSFDEAVKRINTPGHPWAHVDTNKELKRGFTHKAMNRLIQGVSARQTKAAMVECLRAGLGQRLRLQMHDELNASFETEAQGKLLAEIMCAALPMSIPMKVDQEYGINWGRARKTEIKNPDGSKTVTYGATWDEAVAEMYKEAA